MELGDAERIGHGVDVMDETDARDLLKEMAQKHVMVEINLSSNEGDTGREGRGASVPDLLAANVPVALSTDDEGVSRIDLTHEYVRAALDYNLTYRDLKKLARTGMEHSFLPGASLWARPDDFSAPVEGVQGTDAGRRYAFGGVQGVPGREREGRGRMGAGAARFRAFEARSCDG